MEYDILLQGNKSTIALHPTPKTRERAQLELATQGVKTARVSLSEKNGVMFEMDCDAEAPEVVSGQKVCKLCHEPITGFGEMHGGCGDLYELMRQAQTPGVAVHNVVDAIKELSLKYATRKG